MARIYAGSASGGQPITQLEDLKVYPARIAGFKPGPEQTWTKDDGTEKTTQPVIVSLQLSANPDDILEVWLTVSYGENKSTGQIAQFRRFMNAVAGKPERERLEWFDPDTGEAGYPRGEVYELKIGDPVRFAGTNEPSRADNSVTRFKVLKWISARTESAVAPSAKPETPAAFPQALPDRVAEPAPTTDEVPW